MLPDDHPVIQRELERRQEVKHASAIAEPKRKSRKDADADPQAQDGGVERDTNKWKGAYSELAERRGLALALTSCPLTTPRVMIR